MKYDKNFEKKGNFNEINKIVGFNKKYLYFFINRKKNY